MTPLAERIRDEIRSRGPISFARFMELALYAPGDGYYAAGPERLGRRGDFYTASDVGRAFGASLARQVAEIDRALGGPDPCHVVELGAGRGLLARDVLDALGRLDPALAARAAYVMVDSSRGMREAAGRRVPEAVVREPADTGTGHRGCVLAVELFDAIPVHRLRRRDGELREVRVDVDPGGALVEREAPSPPEARAWAERYGAAREEGSEAEFAPAARTQLASIDRLLDRGVVLIVDYGDRAGRLYDGSRREGTLLAYRRHATSRAYLDHVGEQDLTAHVNFSALEDAASDLGWNVLGYTTQDRFLIANGILEAFEETPGASRHEPARVKRRLQALQLIHPEGMGRTFKVLALGKGCAPELAGFRDPFARDATR